MIIKMDENDFETMVAMWVEANFHNQAIIGSTINVDDKDKPCVEVILEAYASIRESNGQDLGSLERQ